MFGKNRVRDDLPLKKITNDCLHDRLLASQRLVLQCMFVFEYFVCE